MLGQLEGKHLESFKAPLKSYNVWNGAVSSGKTITTCLILADFCLHGPPGEIMLIGKTRDTLIQNVIDPLIRIFGKGIRQKGWNVFIFGRRCYIRGANDERAEEKIRGISLVCAYCDELTLYPESFFKMLLSRLRERDAVLIATTNPDGPTHYLMESFLENPKIKPDLNVWPSTMEDNPYLTEEYKQRMLNAYPVGSMWYKRYILGLWVAAEGAIYDMWDPAVHVYKEQPFPVSDYYVSIDYGTANPTAFLLFGVNGNKALCLREYYYDSSKSQRQMTDAEYAVEFKKFVGDLKIKSVIIDPSAASFRTQLRKDGWFVRDANNDVLDGIRTVSTMLHERRLYVHESCKNLIREMPGYAWDPKAQSKGEDRPMKVNDHAVDAARYFCHTVMGKGGYFIPKRGLY
jgi:PBSX family phage terminase large subunit